MSDRHTSTRLSALVTGAGKGIGKAIGLCLARAGYRVALLGRDADALRAVESEIVAKGGEARVLLCDVRAVREIETCVQTMTDQWGAFYLAVCNAGITGPTAVCEEISVKDWVDTIETNLHGVFYTCRAVLPGMKQARRGRVVFISSTSAKRPVRYRTPYAASKMALLGLARSLAAEVGPYGVTVNTLCPGVVTGERWDRVVCGFAAAEGTSVAEVEARYRCESLLGEFVPPGEVATLVTYLASADAGKITGQDINICGGLITY